MARKGQISTSVKGAITIVLGIALVVLFMLNAVPTIFGNDTFAVWLGGTDYGWVITIFVFIMLIVAILKFVDVI